VLDDDTAAVKHLTTIGATVTENGVDDPTAPYGITKLVGSSTDFVIRMSGMYTPEQTQVGVRNS
jgi:hypothetical protein